MSDGVTIAARRAVGRLPLLPLAGLAIVLIAGIAAILLSFAVARANRWVARSIQAQVSVVQVSERLSAYESAYRGFMIRANPLLRTQAISAQHDLAGHLAALRGQVADNPVQRANLAQLTRLIDLRIRDVNYFSGLRARTMLDAMPFNTRSAHTRALLARLHATIDRMFAEEQALLAKRQRQTQYLTAGLAVGLAGAVILVVGVAFVTARDAQLRYAELAAAHRSAGAEMAAREAAEGQLRQIQKMETIGQLTGGIAHDFNNMLAIVIGSLDIARRARPADPQVARGIAAAFDGAQRAAALVARLMAFARRQPLVPVAIDVNAMIGGMTDLLRRTLGEGIRIETALDAETPRCFADSAQLESALLNLAVNARDAMEAGGTLTITTRAIVLADQGEAALAPGRYVEIAVSDTGVGMTPDVIERAFDPFFTTKEVGKGTGLGLSQIFGFARQSRGEVAIESRPGNGTRVTLRLPRSETEAAQASIVADGAAGARQLILVVDDHPELLQVSCEALRELGYAALPANGGEAALALLRTRPDIALLFTDWRMPGMDGPALVREARRLRPDLPLLYTSGFTPERAADDRPADGAIPLLAKPFTLAQLAAQVRAALGSA